MYHECSKWLDPSTWERQLNDFIKRSQQPEWTLEEARKTVVPTQLMPYLLEHGYVVPEQGT